MLRRFTASLAALFLGASPLAAYILTGPRWTSSPVTMQLQLGPNSIPLSDGSASWGAVAEDALTRWNTNIASAQFAVVRNSTASEISGDGVNNVFFSADIYGTAWGTGVLAVTLSYTTSTGTAFHECDVLFNSHLNWDSYRSAQRTAPIGGLVFDLHP